LTLTVYNQTYKPFTFPNLVQRAVDHEKIHWHEEEIDLGEDVSQWNDGTLTNAEKSHIRQILRLFTQTDAQVAQNYCDFFIPTFKNNEVRQMLLAFASREGIHQRAYALLNDTLGFPDEEYKAFLEYHEMSNKIVFAKIGDTSSPEGLARTLARAVALEGVSLFGSFVMLLNYQRFGKMKGMCKIAEWSLRDETQHAEGLSELFKEQCKAYPQVVNNSFKKAIYDDFRTVIALETEFIDLAFDGGGIEGLTSGEVKQYLMYIADERLKGLGMKPNWEVDNPLPWLDYVLSEGQTNFFEQRVSEYSVAGMKGDWGWPEEEYWPNN
jgi:ribonucleoside-diphosphate reductase beta chain